MKVKRLLAYSWVVLCNEGETAPSLQMSGTL